MINLLIEQRGPGGLLKTWRIRPDQEVVTFGTSKHADLRSHDVTVKGIQGFFEKKDNAWIYTSLEVSNNAEKIEYPLLEPIELKVGATRLCILPFEGRGNLIVNIEKSDMIVEGPGKVPFQLFVVYYEGTLLETKVVGMNEKFTTGYDDKHTVLTVQPSNKWVHCPVGNFEINQRTIYLEKNDKLGRMSIMQLIDQRARIPMFATALGVMLLGILFLLAPESKNAGEVAIEAFAPKDVQEIKTVIPKEKRKSAPSENQVVKTPPQNNQNSQTAPTPTATSNRMDSIKKLTQGSRFSQLLGKVSASAAKSANVVVAPKGVEAGSKPSGPAVNALNNISKSDKNWGQEGTAKGVTVSTIGKGSGGVGSIGSLSTGKTGSGGADLIEDEGEVTGGLDREVIAAYIRSQLGQILYCYERQLSASPDLFGKVTIRFTIGPTGLVEGPSIKESSLKQATVEGCILQRVAKWRFPTPDGGTKVNVTYPFLFKSTN